MSKIATCLLKARSAGMSQEDSDVIQGDYDEAIADKENEVSVQEAKTAAVRAHYGRLLEERSEITKAIRSKGGEIDDVRIPEGITQSSRSGDDDLASGKTGEEEGAGTEFSGDVEDIETSYEGYDETLEDYVSYSQGNPELFFDPGTDESLSDTAEGEVTFGNTVKNNLFGEEQAKNTKLKFAFRFPTFKFTLYVQKITSKSKLKIFGVKKEPRQYNTRARAERSADYIMNTRQNVDVTVIPVEGEDGKVVYQLESTPINEGTRLDDGTNESASYYSQIGDIILSGAYYLARSIPRKSIFMINPAGGATIPLSAPLITKLGRAFAGNKATEAEAFSSGISTLLTKGWSIPSEHNGKKYSLERALFRLEISSGSGSTFLKLLGSKVNFNNSRVAEAIKKLRLSIEANEQAVIDSAMLSADANQLETDDVILDDNVDPNDANSIVQFLENEGVTREEAAGLLNVNEENDLAKLVEESNNDSDITDSDERESGVLNIDGSLREVDDQGVPTDKNYRQASQDKAREIPSDGSAPTNVSGVKGDRELFDTSGDPDKPSRKIDYTKKKVPKKGQTTKYGKRISDSLVRWVAGFQKRLGIDTPIVIVDSSDEAALTAAEELLVGGSNLRQLSEEGNTSLGYIVFDGDAAFIVVGKNTFKKGATTKAERDVRLASIIGHEMGHLIFRQIRKDFIRANGNVLKPLFNEAKARAKAKYANSGGHAYLMDDEGLSQEEWFADEFASWMLNPENEFSVENTWGKQPKTWDGLVPYFKELRSRFRKMYSLFVKEGNLRFRATSSEFNTFMQNVIQRDALVRSFSANNMNGSTANFGQAGNGTLAQAIGKALHPSKYKQYSAFVKKALTHDIVQIIPQVFAADAELRTFSKYLADMFAQQSGNVSDFLKTSYFQGVANSRAIWNREWDSVVDEISVGETKKEKGKALAIALDELSRANEYSKPSALSPDARKINDFFKRMRSQYLLPNMGSIGDLPVYFPRMFDLEKIESAEGRVKLHAALMPFVNNRKRVDSIIANILESGGSAEYNFLDSKSIISPSFSSHFSRNMIEDGLNNALRKGGFLVKNDVDVVRNYIASSTKYAELARINGGVKGRDIVTEIEKLPLDQQRRARLIIEGYMGRIGLDTDQRAVKAVSYITVYESYLTLAFAAVASIPDIAGPIIRSRDMEGVKSSFTAARKALASYGSVKDRARLMGILNERMTHQALKEAYGQSKASSGASGLLDKLFKYNGQEYLTNFSRTMSAAVGEEFLTSNARRAYAGHVRAQRYLAELGVTKEQVRSWEADGKKIWSPDSDNADNEAVLKALYKFVDESVLRPNAAQRPTWANHPLAMLVWHLKSFFWAYGKVVIGGVVREMHSRVKEGNGAGLSKQIGGASVPLLIAGLALFPLAAMGRELREFAQYVFDGDKKPSNREDWLEYTWNRFGDAGVLGPFELIGSSTRYSDDPGDTFANLAGPFWQHLNSVFDDVASEDGMDWATIKRSTPFMNQLPWLNDLVKSQF